MANQQAEHITSVDDLLSGGKIGKKQATNRAAHVSAKGTSPTIDHRPRKRERRDLVSIADVPAEILETVLIATQTVSASDGEIIPRRGKSRRKVE